MITINIYSQRDSSKLEQISVDKNIKIIIDSQNNSDLFDTFPKVIYLNTSSSKQNPAYYINGILVSKTILQTLKPEMIESINVDKGTIYIDNVKYYGQIHIKIIGTYNAKLISLNDLKLKYTNIKNDSVLFIVDKEIIDADYDKYLVDEQDILQIIVKTIDNSKTKLKLSIIKLLTRTDENIKKSREIHIHGTDIIENR